MAGNNHSKQHTDYNSTQCVDQKAVHVPFPEYMAVHYVGHIPDTNEYVKECNRYFDLLPGVPVHQGKEAAAVSAMCIVSFDVSYFIDSFHPVLLDSRKSEIDAKATKKNAFGCYCTWTELFLHTTICCPDVAVWIW